MGYVNSQIIVGRLGADPVLMNEGSISVARFPVGTSLLYKKGGETIRETEWHQVVVYGDKAKLVSKELKRGGEVYVKGLKRTSGYSVITNTPRVRTEIIAASIKWPMMGQPGALAATKMPSNIVIGESPEGFEKSNAEVQTGLRIENLGPGLITPAGGVARSNAPGQGRNANQPRGGTGTAGMQLSDNDDEDDFIAGFNDQPVDELAELEDLSARIGTGQDTFYGRQRAGEKQVSNKTRKSTEAGPDDGLPLPEWAGEEDQATI